MKALKLVLPFLMVTLLVGCSKDTDAPTKKADAAYKEFMEQKGAKPYLEKMLEKEKMREKEREKEKEKQR